MAFDLENTLYGIEDRFSSSINLKQQEFKCSIAYIGGIEEAKFNVLLQRQHHPQPELLINSVKEYFKKNSISSWVYVVPSTLDMPLLQRALKGHNLVFDESATAMYYPLGTPIKNIAEPENPLIIQHADINKHGWHKILRDAFGGTELTTAQYAQALDRAKAKVDMQHFLGTLNGEPIAAITLTFANGSVRVDNVATVPGHQQLGYGSQMVQFGINLAHAREFKYCFLDASSNGLNVYKRLGFCEIFTYHIYKYERGIQTKT
jgi:ribosomal protein S18 acetylase RimI-like enzyme